MMNCKLYFLYLMSYLNQIHLNKDIALLKSAHKDFEIQIRPRSGLAANKGVSVLNTPGTIDSDYRGEIKIILINLGNKLFEVNPGDRIAQMVLCPVAIGKLKEVKILPKTFRGKKGFGSTGK